jgi:hypothetical protein
MVIVRPPLAVVHRAASGQVRQAAPNLASPGVAAAAAGPDGHGDARGAGDGLAIKIDGEAVLGEVIFHRRWRLHLDAVADAGVFHAFNQLAGAVGGIAVDRRLAAAPASGPGPGQGDASFLAARFSPGAVLIAGQQVRRSVPRRPQRPRCCPR